MSPQVATQTPETKSFSVNRKLAALIAAVVLVLVGAGLVLYSHLHNSASTYSYKYSKLETFKMTAAGPGSTMSFDRPVEVVSAKKAAAGTTKANLSHKYKGFPVAQIVASVQNSPTFASNLRANSVNVPKDLSDPNNLGFQLFEKPLRSALGSIMDPAYATYNYSKAAAFTNRNIKADAWKTDFTAAGLAEGAESLPPQQGTLIIAAGKSTIYSFILSSLTSNWEQNQSTWQKVLDSIKIDQP
jgi:hypothetical protein